MIYLICLSDFKLLCHVNFDFFHLNDGFVILFNSIHNLIFVLKFKSLFPIISWYFLNVHSIKIMFLNLVVSIEVDSLNLIFHLLNYLFLIIFIC